MKGMPDSKYRPDCFVKGKNAPVQYCDNFPLEWIVKNIFFHFRNLNNFPPNPLNENKTIMQSKNGQEIPFRQGNYLVLQLIEEQKKMMQTNAIVDA